MSIRTPNRGARCALAVAALASVVALAPTPTEEPASASSHVDQVLAWNGIAVAELVVGAGQPPPVAALNLAMVHGAVYDAVNAITDSHQPLVSSPAVADPGDSKDAAAATAAYRVLAHLLPARAAALGETHASALATLTDGAAAIAGGVEVGDAAAAAMLATPAGDRPEGSSATWTPRSGPGAWQPIGGGNNFKWMGDVRPFVIYDPAAFATPGPLDVTSAAYAEEYEQVRWLGRAEGSTRTPDQTEQARFWADHTVAQWNRVFRQLSEGKDLSIDDNARYFAMLHTTGADALIACFQDKERHGFWRPETAINLAADDGNPRTTAEPGWKPLLANPPYPDHPSGANCITSAYVETLRDFFRTNRLAFSVTHNGLGLTRHFSHLSHAVNEVKHARVYAGIHFMTADAQAVHLGREVARWRQAFAFGEV